MSKCWKREEKPTTSAAAAAADAEDTEKEEDEKKEDDDDPNYNPYTGLSYLQWGIPLHTRKVDGYWGGQRWDRERFSRTLYCVLYRSALGYYMIDDILQKLWSVQLQLVVVVNLRKSSASHADGYNVNGAEVARRNGYGYFECMMKHPDFSEVVQFEPVESPHFTYQFRYHAAMSAKYAHLRKSIKPIVCIFDIYGPKQVAKEKAEVEQREKEEQERWRLLTYGEPDPTADEFELLWAKDDKMAATGTDDIPDGEAGQEGNSAGEEGQTSAPGE